MTDNSASRKQAEAVAELMEQGYDQPHAAKVAKQWHPTPAEARMAQARAAKASRNGAQPKSVKEHWTPEGKARVAAANSATTKARWAKVRELGLHSLSELTRYESLKTALEVTE
jgi:hypothetical protein